MRQVYPEGLQPVDHTGEGGKCEEEEGIECSCYGLTIKLPFLIPLVMLSRR